MKINFLGTGTSTGVPQIGCHCPTCESADPEDRRLRASAIVTLPGGGNILIDCGPDFRQQILAAGAPPLEALLITHSHYDHVGGIDDLRPYCKDGRHFPTYCSPDVADDLHARNPWSFATKLYPGVPTFEIHTVEPGKPFEIGGTVIEPLRVMHARLPILGYRIGDRLAYITDCKTMPDETVARLHGIDTLVINALRHTPHMSHLSLEEALALIEKIAPRRAFLTHISHDMGMASTVKLPCGVQLAHDRLTVDI